MRAKWTFVVLAGVLALGACSNANDPASPVVTTSPVTTSPVTTFSAAVRPPQLAAWETTEITIGRRGLLVAVADEPAERQQGLMHVEDLAGLDGMMFIFDEDVATGFWMKDTLIALDVAFFDEDGHLIDVLTMIPCRGEVCPTYYAADAYRFAVEVPAGDFGDLGDEDLLAFE